MLRISMLATSAVAAALLSTSAMAQERAGGTGASEAPNTDIIVTARGREERLQDAPLSITSLDAAEIENANLRDISDLAQVAPGLYYTPQVTFNSSRIVTALRFRGMTIPRNDPLESLGAAFLDGSYLFGGVQSLTFDDIERVEVIKGPQSALFGRGTFSGAINFITREPSDYLSARMSAGVETRGTYNLSGSIEGPLTDQLSFRISGASNEKGAHFKATDGGDLGQEHTDVINAQLVWKPADGLRLRLRHSEAWMDDSRNATIDMRPSRPEVAGAPGICTTGTLPFYCGALPLYTDLKPGGASSSTSLIPPALARSDNPNIIRDILNNNRDNPLVNNGLPYLNKTPKLDHAGLAGRFTRTSFETDYEFPSGMTARLALSKSRAESTSAQSASDDNGNLYVVSANILTDRSIEGRLGSSADGPFTWLVGANYFKQRSLGGPGGTGGLISVLDATGVVSYNEPAVFSGQGEVEYYSGFFGLHYDVTDQIALDAEGRYQVDKAVTSLHQPSETSSTYKKFLPRVIVTFKPGEDTTLYASWARGATRGTTNTNAPLLSPELRAIVEAIPGYSFKVPTEVVDSYELGWKQLVGPVRFAVSGFYMDWQNLKNTVNTPCPNLVCGPGFFGSFAASVVAGDAEIYGVEAELDAQFTPTWSVSAKFDWVHARYGELLTPLTLVPTGQTDATNKVPVGFPEMQGAFSTTYRNDLPLLGGDWFWYARAEANYTGRIYVDEINQSWIDDNVKVNARLGIEGEGRRLELYAQNIFNNKQWQSAVRGSGSNLRAGPRIVSEPTAFVVLPRLRTFGIRASFNF